MKRISAFLIMLGLILGITSFSPTIEAKTTYNTLAIDKKMETRQDFEKGEFKNTKLEEKNNGIEISSLDGQKGEYIAPVVEAPFGATHIGLHWKENIADDASITAFVRTSKNGVNFGDWQEATVELDEGRNDMKNEEIFAALVETEKTKFAQAKIEFPEDGGKNIKLNQLTFTFLNSAEESAQTTKELSLVPSSLASGAAVEKTSPSGQKVSVISREEWGAKEDYRFDRKGNEEWPRSYHGTRKIIVHHTAVSGSNGVTDINANMAAVRSIYYYHAVTQNWGDIGYNALVDAAGNVYEGRYGTHGTSPTRTNPPTADQIMTLDTEAGHTAGFNSGSFGVAAMGDFTSFAIPTDQREGLKKAMAFVADSRGINIQGQSDFLKYDGTWEKDMFNVAAHRDLTATACPGDMLYGQMADIITKTDQLPGILQNLDSFHATMNEANISGTSVGLGTLDFSWSLLGAAKYQYVLERVYGTTGSVNDNESWQTAWITDNDKAVTTADTGGLSLDSGTLLPDSQYVFYVRALDADGKPISNVRHVNFQRDSSTAPVAEDTIAPIANILNLADGATVSGIVSVKATATDNVDVVLFELYIDTKKVASAASGTLSYSWNTRKTASGSHTLEVKASDAAGNVGTASIMVTK